MSSRSARALAATRQEGEPRKTEEGTIAGADAGVEAVLGRDALVAIIPSEALVFYTPIVAIIVSQLLEDESAPDRYMGLRWGLWIATIAVAMALVAKGKGHGSTDLKKWPIAEMFAAGFAFAAWGLSTPESPLLAETKDSLDTVLILLISSGAAVVLSIFAGSVLTKPVKQ